MHRSTLLRSALALAVCALAVGVWTVAAPPAVSQDAAPAPTADGFVNPFLGLAPPPNAVVVFDGASMDGWTNGGDGPCNWVLEDGVMIARGGDAFSKATFRDAYIHIEFRCPLMPDSHGQGRGNSGVFLRDRIDREIQVLDSYGKETLGTGDCGAIYGQHAALVNACRPPEEWQTYDIIFRSARLSDTGEALEPDKVTVFHNGVVIQNNVELSGPYDDQPGRLHVQDHGCPVAYRNVWWVELPLKGSDAYE